MMAPVWSCNTRVGSASAPATPAAPNDGPIARTRTFLSPAPVTMNPPIRTFSPVPTLSRVEMFPRFGGSGAGRAVRDQAGVPAPGPRNLVRPVPSLLIT